MVFENLFQWLYDTPFATAIRESSYLFPWIESVHVLALTVVVGSIAVVDLRLLGIASRRRSVGSVAGEILPLTWIAFAVAAVTGFSLFCSHAVGYSQNFQFRMKILFLCFAGINMATFHWVMGRGKTDWNDPSVTPWPGQMAGLISIVLWICIVAFGRWIGFRNVS